MRELVIREASNGFVFTRTYVDLKDNTESPEIEVLEHQDYKPMRVRDGNGGAIDVDVTDVVNARRLFYAVTEQLGVEWHNKYGVSLKLSVINNQTGEEISVD